MKRTRKSFVAAPILQFFGYRWLWRLLIWTCFLRDLSRLNLNLVATHPDRAGGLGFLGAAHTSLAIFSFAFILYPERACGLPGLFRGCAYPRES